MIEFWITLVFIGTLINLALLISLCRLCINVYEMLKIIQQALKISDVRRRPTTGLKDVPENQIPYHLPQP